MNPSRNHTITSSYQMRKPRHQNNVNGQKGLKCTPPKASTSENDSQRKFRSPISTRNEVATKRGLCSKQPLRRWRLTHRMKDTSAVICSSPDDSEPEITWALDSQIPEKRIKPGDTGEDSVLNLLKRVFPSTKPERAKNEDNYIDLWLARRKENDILPAPVKSTTRSAVRARSQLEKKFQIAEELQELVNQVANAAAAKDNEHAKRTNNLDDSQRNEQSNLYDPFKQSSNPEVPHGAEMRTGSNDDNVSTNNRCDDQGNKSHRSSASSMHNSSIKLCTPEEIEQKRLAALEKRRKFLQQKSHLVVNKVQSRLSRRQYTPEEIEWKRLEAIERRYKALQQQSPS